MVDIRTDYTIVNQNGTLSILFTNPIVLEKIKRIVNVTKQSEIYIVDDVSVKARASISGQSITFASPPILAVNDILHIEYFNDSETAAATALSQINAKTYSERLDLPISKESIASLVVSQDFLTKVALGLVNGCSLVLKNGRNPDIDTATVPESIWNGGGLYTGFPVGVNSTGELQIFSSSNSDTGTVTFLYLPSDTATSYLQQTVQLAGTTLVNTGINAYRVHYAWYTPPAPNTATASNAGVITMRHRNTPANIFFTMPIGKNQTYAACYTIPNNCTGLLVRTQWGLAGASNVYSEQSFYVRRKNEGFRLMHSSSITFGSSSISNISGGLLLPAGTDIMPQTDSVSANNLIGLCEYDILLISPIV